MPLPHAPVPPPLPPSSHYPHSPLLSLSLTDVPRPSLPPSFLLSLPHALSLLSLPSFMSPCRLSTLHAIFLPSSRASVSPSALPSLTPRLSPFQVKQVFTANNLKYQEVIADLQDAINEQQKDDYFFSWNRPAHPMTWEKYHSFDGKIR